LHFALNFSQIFQTAKVLPFLKYSKAITGSQSFGGTAGLRLS
jgi:hypothetical protein